jgi:hypothetical protein
VKQKYCLSKVKIKKLKLNSDASLLLFSQIFEFYSFDCVALIFSLVLSFASRQKKEQ